MNADLIKKILEGALLAAGKSLDIVHLERLFEDDERPPRDQIKAALEEIDGDCRERGFSLKKTASGYRFQVDQEFSVVSVLEGILLYHRESLRTYLVLNVYRKLS